MSLSTVKIQGANGAFDEYTLGIEDITRKTVNLLRTINVTVFPSRFPESYYNDVLKPTALSRLAYFNDVCVGSVTADIECNSGADAASKAASAKSPRSKMGAYKGKPGKENLPKGNSVEPPEKVYISSLAVLGPYRNMGIGTKLLEQVVNFSKEAPKVKYIYLHVKSANVDAIKFYEKNGFESKEVVKNYYNLDIGKWDAVIMEKTL